MKRKRDRAESKQIRAKINRWVRFLIKEGDWDYGFLIEMERMKLQQMEKYFNNRNTFVGIEYVQRDLKLCLHLLDIVQEKDNLDIELSPIKFVPFRDKEGRKLYKLESESKVISYRKLYVNTRNANRFTKFDFSDSTDEALQIIHKERLRKEKAWHLYNLIRTYRMFNWWN